MLPALKHFALLAFGLLAVGCRVGEVRLPETGATLEGTVTYGADKVPMAMIIVMGEGGTATGYIESDGRYKVENAPLGNVKIGVNTDAARGQYISQAMSQQYQGPGGKGAKKAAVPFISVAQKYAEPENSGITTTVKKGTNTFDITLAK